MRFWGILHSGWCTWQPTRKLTEGYICFQGQLPQFCSTDTYWQSSWGQLIKWLCTTYDIIFFQQNSHSTSSQQETQQTGTSRSRASFLTYKTCLTESAELTCYNVKAIYIKPPVKGTNLKPSKTQQSMGFYVNVNMSISNTYDTQFMAKTKDQCTKLYLRHAAHYTTIKLALELQICICHKWTSRPTDVKSTTASKVYLCISTEYQTHNQTCVVKAK
jgi:hypothetical protein